MAFVVLIARLVAVTGILLSGVAHGGSYSLSVVASTASSFSNFGQHVSINDSGQVAFVGTDSAGQGVFVADPVAVPREITGNQTLLYGVGAWINNNGVVAARAQRTGTTIGASIQRLYDGNDVGDFLTVASGGVGELFPFPVHPDDFDAIFSFGSLNNNIDVGFFGFSDVDGNIVYSGIATGSTLVAVDTPPVAQDTGDLTFAQTTPIRPSIADDGRVVLKTGPNADSSLVIWNPGLSSADANIASSSRGFTELGRSPGITDDGRVVVFYGNLTNVGACTSCDSTVVAGPGVFASVQTASGRVTTQVAGPDQGFTAFDGGFRIGVNSTAVDQRGVTVAYIGTRNGTQGVYTSRLNFYDRGVGPYNANDPDSFNATPPVAVIEAGDAVPGVGGTAQTFGLFDPVNSRDRGDLAFWVGTETGQAVVRARSAEMVYIDFDPQSSFASRVSAQAQQIFNQGLGTTTGLGWVGDLQQILDIRAPGRFSTSDVASIKQGVVQAVQQAFTNAGVNVQVVSTKPETDDYMHVFVGDSAGFVTVNGMASSIDIFNQDLFDGLPNAFLPAPDIAGIFADNILSAGGIFDPIGLSNSQITNLLANIIAHEAGHNLGLMHVNDAADIMAQTSIAGANRFSPQSFGTAPKQLLEVAGASQTAQQQLQFAVGTNADVPRPIPVPNALIVNSLSRNSLDVGAVLNQNPTLLQGVLGIVVSEDVMPLIVNLGGGALDQLLRGDFAVPAGASVFFVGSTNGQGIDVFGVNPDFVGDVESIDLTSFFSVLANQDIRSDFLQTGGGALNFFQVANGVAAPIGSVTMQIVPEPSTIAGMALASVLLAFSRLDRGSRPLSGRASRRQHQRRCERCSMASVSPVG